MNDFPLAAAVLLGALALAAAFVVAARIKAHARVRCARIASKTAEDDCLAESGRRAEDRRTNVRCASIAADARVKAAKYAGGAIRQRPRTEPDRELTVFETWMRDEGKRKPQADQDAAEWAFAYVAGEDSGSEAGDSASPDGAREIIERICGPAWWSTAVEAAKRPR